MRTIKHGRFRIHNAIIVTNSKAIQPKTCAQIFFGLYESAEIRYALQYIPDNSTVIELGSSIGIVSSVVARNKVNCNLFCIEINPHLIPVLKENLEHNTESGYAIFNYALIGAVNSNAEIYFEKGSDSTTGKITRQASEITEKIEAISLSGFLKQQKIKEYVMICDIEGAEIDLLLNDHKALIKCRLLIIEVHQTFHEGREYTIEDMKNLILAIGFEMVDNYGPNFVFKRS